MESYNYLMDEVEKFLNRPGKINDYMTMLELSTGIKRMYIAKGVMAFIALYMIFGYFAQLICNTLGFVYPAYKSLRALETSTKEDDTSWLTYWVVFAFFSVIEFFIDQIFFWFPFYWLAKVCFLIWCFLPVSNNGTDFVYKRIIRPFFVQNADKIEKFSNKVMNEVSDSMKKK